MKIGFIGLGNKTKGSGLHSSHRAKFWRLLRPAPLVFAFVFFNNQGKIAGIFIPMISEITNQKVEISPTLKTRYMSDKVSVSKIFFTDRWSLFSFYDRLEQTFVLTIN